MMRCLIYEFPIYCCEHYTWYAIRLVIFLEFCPFNFVNVVNILRNYFNISIRLCVHKLNFQAGSWSEFLIEGISTMVQ